MRVIPYRCMTDMVEREEREVEEGEKVGGGLWLSEGSRPTCGSRFESLPPGLDDGVVSHVLVSGILLSGDDLFFRILSMRAKMSRDGDEHSGGQARRLSCT